MACLTHYRTLSACQIEKLDSSRPVTQARVLSGYGLSLCPQMGILPV